MTDYLNSADIAESKRVLLWWQKRGLQYTASGYGAKIPSEHMVRIGQRWHRVYVMCYGNSGSAYIIRNGQRQFIREDFLS